MGVKQSREVRTTYVCDFCKHHEVLVAETSHERLPNGWSVLTIVPGDQNPRIEQMPSPDYYARDGNRRSCLSSDREINLAIACPECSIYGLQAIKNAKPEAPGIKYAFRLTSTVFYVLLGCSIFLGTVLGFTLDHFLRR